MPAKMLLTVGSLFAAIALAARLACGTACTAYGLFDPPSSSSSTSSSAGQRAAKGTVLERLRSVSEQLQEAQARHARLVDDVRLCMQLLEATKRQCSTSPLAREPEESEDEEEGGGDAGGSDGSKRKTRATGEAMQALEAELVAAKAEVRSSSSSSWRRSRRGRRGRNRSRALLEGAGVSDRRRATAAAAARRRRRTLQTDLRNSRVEVRSLRERLAAAGRTSAALRAALDVRECELRGTRKGLQGLREAHVRLITAMQRGAAERCRMEKEEEGQRQR